MFNRSTFVVLVLTNKFKHTEKMETLSKKYLIYSDINYTKAINYSHKYNAPITLNFGPKHNIVKYILSAGSGDGITLLQEGIYIYVISIINGAGACTDCNKQLLHYNVTSIDKNQIKIGCHTIKIDECNLIARQLKWIN